MFNYIIGAVLLYALIAGTKFEDYKFKAREIPWLILTIGGFTLSFLGLFKFNDERIIFAGCLILLIAKGLTWFELKKYSKTEGGQNA